MPRLLVPKRSMSRRRCQHLPPYNAGTARCPPGVRRLRRLHQEAMLRDARPRRRTPPIRRIAAGQRPPPPPRPSALRRLRRRHRARRRALRPYAPGRPRSRPTEDTYATLIHGCCCRAHRQGLALALLGHVVKTGVGLGVDGAVCKSILKALCFHGDMGPEEALDVLHQWMPELGCAPCFVSYTIVLKSLCDKGRSQQALQLLRTMGWRRRCLLTKCGVVNHGHPWISHGLALFDEIKKQGIAPSVATYNSIISFWCKANSIEKAEAILQQMVDNGVTPDDTTFGTMMLGYSKVGQWKEVDRMFNAMTSQGRYPNLTTCNIYMAAVCKQGSGKDAREICKWPET